MLIVYDAYDAYIGALIHDNARNGGSFESAWRHAEYYVPTQLCYMRITFLYF